MSYFCPRWLTMSFKYALYESQHIGIMVETILINEAPHIFSIGQCKYVVTLSLWRDHVEV